MADFFTRPVVCNTGPLIALSRAGLGDLLTQLFPRVITTSLVLQELYAKDAGDGAQIQATLASGIETVVASIPDPLHTTELDPGEASVIQAARDLSLSGVLIDERRARRIEVEAYSLEVRGTCAVLVRAKRRGLLAKVRPALDAMIAGGYFIGPHLVAETVKQAGE